MKRCIHLLEVNQPIGNFYIGVLPAEIISKITRIGRKSSSDGVQRDLSAKRVNEIKEYCSEPDATFPTPIIIAVDGNQGQFANHQLTFDDSSVIGEVIDGQHRIEGIRKCSNISNFDLPVVFMFDLTMEEKAYVFSIINSKQTKVPMSLIYDLFELSKERSPQKTCHELARSLNNDHKSPFFKKLKMLGKKTHEDSSLSQGSFAKYLLPLISKDFNEDRRKLKQNLQLTETAALPFRQYFIDDQDDYIYKILFNMFSALKAIFEEEWVNSDKYILSKTIGYGAILRAFPKMYEIGLAKRTLNYTYFCECFSNLRNTLQNDGLELTSKYFSSNEQQQKKLADIIIRSIN